MSNVVKNVRKGDVWDIGGELNVKAGAKLNIEDGAEINGIPAATTTTGGTVKMAATQADSTATTVAELKGDLNALLAKLKTAGIMSST